MEQKERLESPDQPPVTDAIQLLPTRWRQSISQLYVDETDINLFSSRSIECECKIILPDSLALNNREDNWPDIECHLTISPEFKRENDNKQRPRPKEIGAVIFNTGWGPSEYDNSTHPDWISVKLATSASTFNDLWERVTNHVDDEVIVSIETTGLKQMDKITAKLGIAAKYEWDVENNDVLSIYSFCIDYNQKAIENVDATLYAIRTRRPEEDARSIPEVKESVLKNNLADESTLGRNNYSQFNEIANQIANCVESYSIEHDEDAWTFESRVADALDVLRNVRYAVNTKVQFSISDESEEREKERAEAEHYIWTHGNPEWAFQYGYESEYYKEIEVPSLCKNVAEYLQRPWMSNPTLEWMIVDALVYAEITQFGEAIKQYKEGGFLGLNWAYEGAKGNVWKMQWGRFKYGLIGLAIKAGIYIALPAGVLYLAIQHGHEDEAILGGLIYFTLLFSIIILRWLYRLVTGKKPESAKDKLAELWEDMTGVYRLLSPGDVVINAGYVKERLLAVANKGAVWKGAMFSVLDNAIKRDPAVWRVPEETEYHE